MKRPLRRVGYAIIVMVVFAMNRIVAEILQRILHEAQVPFEPEAQPSHVTRA